MKKILIALTSSDFGGGPKVVYDFLSHIKTKDFGFVVAAPSGGLFMDKFRQLGYEVYEIPLNRLGPGGFLRLHKVARKERVDLISSHGKGAGLYARVVGFLLGIPVVQTFHGIHYTYKSKIVRCAYIFLERVLTRVTRLVINVSSSQERIGLALGLFPKEKSRVVINGIDTEDIDKIGVDRRKVRFELGLGLRDFVAVMVARFDPVKGHLRLVKLLPELVEAIPNLKVVFVGDGELRAEAEELAKKLGVFGAARFLGFRKDVYEILEMGDAFILSSFREGLPLTVLEAMACGLPVVGSDVVGIRDVVVNGETGYLVDFDSSDLKEALQRLYSDRALREKMGKRGRERVEAEFSLDRFVEDTLGVYKEILQ